MSDIKKAAQANLSNPKVGLDESYGSEDAVDAAMAYSRKSYDQAIKEKGQIKDLYSSLVTYLNGLSSTDIMARLQSYGSPEIIPHNQSRNSLINALAKTMITRLSKKDLQQIVGDVEVSNKQLINDLRKDITKSQKQYVNLKSLQTYEDIYGDRNTGKPKNERMMKNLLKGTGLLGLDYIFGKKHGMQKLYKELMSLLNGTQPTELAEIALSCGIEFKEGAARKSIASLIANKCCMYAAIILGKSKMTMAAGGTVREKMDELIGMTSFAYVVGKDAVDQDFIIEKRREMEQAKVRARIMQQAMRRRGSAIGKKGLRSKVGLASGLRTMIAGRKKVKLPDQITYVRWITNHKLPGLVLSVFNPADVSKITQDEIDAWLQADNGDGRTNEGAIREYADSKGVENALHYGIFWVIEQIGGPSQSAIKAAEKENKEYEKMEKHFGSKNIFRLLDPKRYGKRREAIERNHMAQQDVLSNNKANNKTKTDRNGDEIRKDASGKEIRKGQPGYETATAVTESSFSANVAETEKPNGGATPSIQLKEASTLEDVDWVVPVYVVNGSVGIGGGANIATSASTTATASIPNANTTATGSLSARFSGFNSLKSRMDAMDSKKAATSAELMASNPGMTQSEADAESARQASLLELKSKADGIMKANSSSASVSSKSTSHRENNFGGKRGVRKKGVVIDTIPTSNEDIYSTYARKKWKRAAHSKETYVSPVFVTNKFTDRIDEMLNSSKNVQSATQSIYDYMTTYLPVLFGGLQEAGLSANISAVTSTGVLTASAITNAASTVQSLASTHLGAHAKGAVGKTNGRATQFIAGDSLNSKPNPELVTIDNKSGEYYVKPVVNATPSINRFATGGSGASSDGTSTALTSTERQAPMSVAISSGLVSYQDTVSGALNDGTSTALKVWAVNGGLDRKYKVGDAEVSLMEIVYGVYGQVTGIAASASASAQYLASLASTAGSILTMTKTIASTTGSSSGTSDPFSSTGMENILSGT